MASSLPLQVAETIQTAHINRNPSAQHDVNPSTAAGRVEPVTLRDEKAATRRDGYDDQHDGGELDDEEHGDELGGGAADEEDDIPSSVLKPRRRHSQLPPLPDLRFEQSYLHSIAQADTWWKVAWITTRDQIMMPLAQGVLYNLAICGWQHWNRNAQIHGASVGARLRRWWYGVNNWAIPPEKSRTAKQTFGRSWS